MLLARPRADSDQRERASESPRVARSSHRCVEPWVISIERHVASSPCRPYVAPVRCSTTSISSATSAGSASVSRVARAASRRAMFAVAIEPLDAVDQAVGAEGAQREELCLDGPATGPVGAAKDLGDEERIRLHGEDIVEADGGDVGEIEPGAHVPQELLRSLRGPGPQSPVVDVLDGGGERLGKAIEVAWLQRQGPHRAR